MNLIKKHIFLLLLLVTSICNGQAIKIEVLQKSTFESNLKKYNSFLGGRAAMYFLNSKFDTSYVNYIATLKAKTEKRWPTIEEVYNKVVNKANSLGANAFTTKQVHIADSIVFVFDFYYATDETLNANRLQTEKNVVYIFGNLDKGMPVITYKVNKEKDFVHGGFYKKYTLDRNTTTVFSKSVGLAWGDVTLTANNSSYIFTVAGLANNARKEQAISTFANGIPLTQIEYNLGMVILQGLQLQD
jgi:hypothetical protein